MNSYSLNYNVPAAATHKFYCGTTVYASISSTATTINNTLTLAPSKTLSDSTVFNQTMLKALATNSTAWLKQATTLTPVYYNTGRRIILGCDSANNSYMDFYSIDAGTGNPDVRMQASGGTVGSNFGGTLSWFST